MSQPPPEDVLWPDQTLFTCGHSTLPIEQFIARLKIYGIKRLVDIRSIRRSRHNPQFNGDALEDALSTKNIEYFPLPELGGLRPAHKDGQNDGWRNKSFRGYADYMQTAAFDGGLRKLIEMNYEKRTAIMCAEAVPWRCHRSLVADALQVHGVPTIEILSDTSYRAHTLTPFAKVEGQRITYPPEQTELLLPLLLPDHINPVI